MRDRLLWRSQACAQQHEAVTGLLVPETEEDCVFSQNETRDLGNNAVNGE